MSAIALYALDVLAAGVLAFGIYWPRHRRRDLVVAFLGINVGVLAVCALLANSAVTAGIGLGLFGVLSIIRLRSDELAQHEIAYYFAFLALALVGGLGFTSIWLGAGFLALIVGVMAAVDHPSLLAAHRRQVMVIDRALTDERALRSHLEETLGADVTAFTVQKVDLVSDTTTVDVRYRVRSGRRSALAGTSAEPAAAFDGTEAPRAFTGPIDAPERERIPAVTR